MNASPLLLWMANELDDYYERESVIRPTCHDIRRGIFRINNFNFLMHDVCPYVACIPNYDMQTGLNIGNDLMAYTMYLFQLLWIYYNTHEQDRTDRILPYV